MASTPIVPIWKDYNVLLGSDTLGTGLQWRIKDGPSWLDEVIYEGRAFPVETALVFVKINDICADYLNRSNGWQSRMLFHTFVVEAYIGNAWTAVDTVIFRNDWSYDDAYDPAVAGCNFPVVPVLLPGQYVPLSWAGAGNTSAEAVVTMRDGIATPVTYTGVAEGHQHWLDLSQYANAVSVAQEDGPTYSVLQSGCNQYALYYVNAYGYWDTLVVQGITAEEDVLTRHTYDTDYDNRQPQYRGSWNSANELKHQYTFNTRPLTEAESLLMQHLLNSPLVYLHDVARGVVRPLVLTDSSTPYKHGDKLYVYTFKARLGQERLRR